jgi:hypothetical protein
MHRSTQVIEQAITVQRQAIADAQQHLATLEIELNTARALELAGRRQQGRIAHVLARMDNGEQIVTTPRTWWCRDGQLIDRATGDDMEAMFALRDQGVIDTIRR